MTAAKAIAVTLVKVFLAALLGYFITNGFDLTVANQWSSWQPAVAAALAAVLIAAYNFLAPASAGGSDKYGVGKK